MHCMKRVSGSQTPGAAPTEASTAPAIVKQSAGKGRAWWQVSYFLCLPRPFDKSIIFVEIKNCQLYPKVAVPGVSGCAVFSMLPVGRCEPKDKESPNLNIN